MYTIGGLGTYKVYIQKWAWFDLDLLDGKFKLAVYRILCEIALQHYFS